MKDHKTEISKKNKATKVRKMSIKEQERIVVEARITMEVYHKDASGHIKKMIDNLKRLEDYLQSKWKEDYPGLM